jgi:uncharacterized protein YyaL (SSP411 family)
MSELEGLARDEQTPNLESVASTTMPLFARCAVRADEQPEDEQPDTSEELSSRRWSFLDRLRASAQVMRGHRLVPAQIHAEWIEYQQLLDDLLKRLSAQLARQARSEKARVKQLLEQQQTHLELAVDAPRRSNGRKSDLRRLYASQLGLRAPSSSAVPAPALPEPEEEAP